MEAMVTRLLEQENALRVVLGSDRKISHLNPTWQDMQVFESISQALSPISDLTDFLSGENQVTVSSIIPVLHNLKTKILIRKEEETQLTRDIKQVIMNDLEVRYSNSGIQKLLHIATFLDPRFKADYSNDKEEVKTLVMEQAKEIFEVQTSPEPDSQFTTPQPPAKKKAKMCAFLKRVEDEREPSDSVSPESKIASEIESYVSAPNLDIESDLGPLNWWKENRKLYPTLAKLSVKILCICATSCASERLFSTSGHIVNSRSSLNPDKVNMLVFLAKNLDQLLLCCIHFIDYH